MNEALHGRTVTVLVATELLPELNAWSHPVQVQIVETPDIGTGYEMIFQTVGIEAERDAERARADRLARQIETVQMRLNEWRDGDPASCLCVACDVLNLLDAPADTGGTT